MGRMIIPIVIIVIYLAVMLTVGFMAWRIYPSKTTEDYLMAGRSISAVVGFFSLTATQYSALTFAGFVAYYYLFGISSFVAIMGMYVFGAAIFWFFFGPRIWKLGRKYGHRTPSDQARHYFNSPIFGYVVAAGLIISIIPYLMAQVTGISIILKVATAGAVPFWLGGLILMLVIAAYIWAGGLRAVAWTDVVQGVMLFGALFIGGIALVFLVGGGFHPAFVKILEEAPKKLVIPGAAGPGYSWLFLMSWIIPVGLGWPMHPHMWLRMHYFERGRSLYYWPMILALSFFIVLFGGYMVAMSGTIVMPGARPDALILLMFEKYFPLALFGIIAAAALAAMQSSAGSQAHGITTVVTNDFAEKLKPKWSEGSHMLVARIAMTACLILAWAMAVFLPRFILVSGAAAASIGTSLFLPQAVASLSGLRFYTRQGAIAASIAGLMACIAFLGAIPGLTNLWGIYGGFWGLIANLIALHVVSALTQKDKVEQEMVEKCKRAFETPIGVLEKESKTKSRS